ncbi:hypothetical protein D3C83_90540 [compost metagenome]
MRHPYLLTRRTQGNAALPVQPVRAAFQTRPTPAGDLVELADQDQQFKRSGVDVPRQLGDAHFQRFDALDAGVGRGIGEDGKRIGRHGETPGIDTV